MKIFNIISTDLSVSHKRLMKIIRVIPFMQTHIAYVITDDVPSNRFPMNDFLNFKKFILDNYVRKDISKHEAFVQIESQLKKERVEFHGLIRLIYDVYEDID